jgi:hypothetical protein
VGAAGLVGDHPHIDLLSAIGPDDLRWSLALHALAGRRTNDPSLCCDRVVATERGFVPLDSETLPERGAHSFLTPNVFLASAHAIDLILPRLGTPVASRPEHVPIAAIVHPPNRRPEVLALESRIAEATKMTVAIALEFVELQRLFGSNGNAWPAGFDYNDLPPAEKNIQKRVAIRSKRANPENAPWHDLPAARLRLLRHRRDGLAWTILDWQDAIAEALEALPAVSHLLDNPTTFIADRWTARLRGLLRELHKRLASSWESRLLPPIDDAKLYNDLAALLERFDPFRDDLERLPPLSGRDGESALGQWAPRDMGPASGATPLDAGTIDRLAVRTAAEMVKALGDAKGTGAAQISVVLWEGAPHTERNVRLARTRSAYLEAHGNVAAALDLLKNAGNPVSRSTFYNHLDALDAEIPRWREAFQLSNPTGNLDGMRNVGSRGKTGATLGSLTVQVGWTLGLCASLTRAAMVRPPRRTEAWNATE